MTVLAILFRKVSFIANYSLYCQEITFMLPFTIFLKATNVRPVKNFILYSTIFLKTILMPFMQITALSLIATSRIIY